VHNSVINQSINQSINVTSVAMRFTEDGLCDATDLLFCMCWCAAFPGVHMCSSSACDPHGEVWDVSGLYCADGSVFPTPSGVNPMITIYGVAYLTAQRIASKWRQHQQQQRPGINTSPALSPL
jgi:hypothetical protein